MIASHNTPNNNDPSPPLSQTAPHSPLFYRLPPCLILSRILHPVVPSLTQSAPHGHLFYRLPPSPILSNKLPSMVPLSLTQTGLWFPCPPFSHCHLWFPPLSHRLLPLVVSRLITFHHTSNLFHHLFRSERRAPFTIQMLYRVSPPQSWFLPEEKTFYQVLTSFW